MKADTSSRSASHPLRILGLVPYPQNLAPGQRYRIEQWVPLLKGQDIQVEFAPFLSEAGLRVLYLRGHVSRKALETLRGCWRRAVGLAGRASFDAAYLYREALPLGPPWIEARWARRMPLIFDFDDAIFLRATSAANAWTARFKPRDKTERICRVATHVTVGNEFLASWARRHSAAVTVIPTTIDTDTYVPTARAPNPRPIVGWTGSRTTVPYLQALAPALRRLRQHVEFELRVIGGEIELSGLDVRCVPWRSETEVEDLRPLDVGLMPLTDDEWSRGKCALKALQYMALGIPAVVSPVGANATVVQDGVNGSHARNDAEWVDRIASLLRDPGLRMRMGAAARRTVEGTYSGRVQAPRMAAVLREAVDAWQRRVAR
jgi:glycosyltransferase involved in cell wall biosynthesis